MHGQSVGLSIAMALSILFEKLAGPDFLANVLPNEVNREGLILYTRLPKMNLMDAMVRSLLNIKFEVHLRRRTLPTWFTAVVCCWYW
jgi:hypothetical protein